MAAFFSRCRTCCGPRTCRTVECFLFSRKINLALQGGGALGAFTWGVLDRLLEEPGLRFEAISGSSAGAMNAIALAHGLAQGGVQGARESLEAFWTAVGSAPYAGHPALGESGAQSLGVTSAKFLLGLTRFFSPYQLNPFDINPLRSIIEKLFDFERLRRASPVRLFVGATHVPTGALRVFTGAELTAEHLLASACLPALNQAVMVQGEAYWDGGYTGNPPLYPLIYDCRGKDLLLVLVLPLMRQATPTTAERIRSRLTEIHFNTTLLRELRGLALMRRFARTSFPIRGTLERRMLALRPHLIETDDKINQLELEKAMNTSLPFLLRMKDEGRGRAQDWLSVNRALLGRRATLDLERFAMT
jgi:NTE family protein